MLDVYWILILWDVIQELALGCENVCREEAKVSKFQAQLALSSGVWWLVSSRMLTGKCVGRVCVCCYTITSKAKTCEGLNDEILTME